MEQSLFKSTLTQFGVFMLITIIIVSVTFWFIKHFIFKKNKMEEYNSAYSITCSGLIFSMFYVMSGLIIPVTSTLKLLENDGVWNYALEVSKYLSLFILIGMISVFIIYFVSIRLLSYFSKGILIFNEIKENNIGQSVLIFVILFSFSLMMKDVIITLISSFVPYPEMPNLLN